MKILRPHLRECLRADFIHDKWRSLGVPRAGSWYNDEVVLGRCTSLYLGISCHGFLWGKNSRSMKPRFQGGLIGANKFEEFVAASVANGRHNISSVGTLTVHAAAPEQMRRLAKLFSPEVDLAWARRFAQYDAAV